MEFSKDERGIFRYFDGMQEVVGDPLEIRRELVHALGGNANQKLNELDFNRAGKREEYPSEEDYKIALEAEAAGEPVRYEAAKAILAAVRSAFHMTPFVRSGEGAGQGAREDHCWKVLWDFLDYQESLKNGGGPSPT